jgi:hypothetical protein
MVGAFLKYAWGKEPFRRLFRWKGPALINVGNSTATLKNALSWNGEWFQLFSENRFGPCAVKLLS